jgi:cellulose synthase/poly-beta-1,6-N-acetylglucosamine synthase-like glycosyltransferase
MQHFFISILLAVRNESKNILTCLEKLSKLDYPANSWEVWIGNDASEDDSRAIIERFIQDKNNFHLLDITSQVGFAKGKANVLAHLAEKAKGDLFFFTDADMRISANSLRILSSFFEKNNNLGILTGFTLPKGEHIFHHLQALDWVFGLGILKTLTVFKVPSTAMGNNMLVKSEAYKASGGYANIPFSVTEDFALYQAIVARKYDFEVIIEQESMAFTLPMNTWGEFIGQRKRWMRGAMQSKWTILIGIFNAVLFLPLMTVLFFFAPLWALSLYATKWAAQSWYIFSILQKIRQTQLAKYLFLYEFYLQIWSWQVLMSFLVSPKIVWKGRRYD